MLMSPNHCRIEQQCGQIGILKCAEDLFPHTSFGPAIEPLKHRVPPTEPLR